MAETIDDLSIEYEEDGVKVIQQEDKAVLTRGNWTTIMYLYRELDKKRDDFGSTKVSIRRYQKRNGIYKQQSKFNISSPKQSKDIIRALNRWYPDEDSDDEVGLVGE